MIEVQPIGWSEIWGDYQGPSLPYVLKECVGACFG